METIIEPIGILRSCYPEKFGTPRQPNLVKNGQGVVEILSPYTIAEAFYNLEAFSHIWLIFSFSQAISRGWQPSVRPPRLGGNTKVGVFASRSPQRPNFLGLSAVKLEHVDISPDQINVHVSGLDIVDDTPIYDIKPYIPYSDNIEACDGYAPTPQTSCTVTFSDKTHAFCKGYEQRTGRDLQPLIKEVLSQDPRPAYHKQEGKEYGVRLWDTNIRFRYHKNSFLVFDIENI